MKKGLGSIILNVVLGILCIIWFIPTFGLLLSSFRKAEDIKMNGWWTVFPHKEWVTTEEISDLPRSIDNETPFSVEGIDGVTATYPEWKSGILTPDGKRAVWSGNKKLSNLKIQEKQWVSAANRLTLENYNIVLGGKNYQLVNADGTSKTVKGGGLFDSFLNSISLAVPSAVIPILIASFAAYGFAWMKFPGRKFILSIVTMLLVVPYQVSLIPILTDYTKLGINGTFLSGWLAHTGFGLALAVYYLYNAVAGLPREMLESAFIDGASHFKVFTNLVIPTTIPTMISFMIFQFIWTWNDYFVNMIFLGEKNKVLTKSLADMIGERGADWHLLTAGAVVSMILPLIIFYSLQKYYVRGLLAGSVKG